MGSPRLGELFLTARDGVSFLHSSTHSNAVITGHHGSATTTAVPFLIASGAPSLAEGIDADRVARAIDVALRSRPSLASARLRARRGA